MNGGVFAFAKIPPSVGHSSHPADGIARGKIFYCPVLLKILSITGKEAGG
jgi:hypothetical protein